MEKKDGKLQKRKISEGNNDNERNKTWAMRRVAHTQEKQK